MSLHVTVAKELYVSSLRSLSRFPKKRLMRFDSPLCQTQIATFFLNKLRRLKSCKWAVDLVIIISLSFLPNAFRLVHVLHYAIIKIITLGDALIISVVCSS